MALNRRNFVRGALLAGSALPLRNAAAALAPSRPTAAPVSSLDELQRDFADPPKRFRPMVRWWWPGDDVTEPELIRELGALDEAGFGGAEVQAFFKGLDPAHLSASSTSRINGFATPTYFRHVAAAAKNARERGLFLDATFGSGWPFGGGYAITPELAAIELRWSHTTITGPATFDGRLQVPSVTDGDSIHPSDAVKDLPPGWPERMQQRAKIVAAVAVRGIDTQWAFFQQAPRGRGVIRPGQLERNTSIDLTTHLAADGTLHWDVPEGTWQVFVFCSLPTGQRINAGAGEGPQLVLDHLSAAAFRAHAHRVGDAGIPYLQDVLGNGLRAVFCDSLEVRARLFWSDDFLAEFERRRGYSLVPFLPILQSQVSVEPADRFVDTPVFDIPEIGPQVRHDYRATVAELMTERFYDEFNRWTHAHGLLARTQSHGAPVDVLRVYADADIPETESLYDTGAYDFLKQAPSAAHVRGRSIVSCEAFAFPGAIYQVTPQELKRAGDEMFTAGVNEIIYHGFAYRIDGMPAPGWHPFSGINSTGDYSTQCNEQNPLWPSFAKLNRYFTRLQYISQNTRNVSAVALFHDALTHGAEQQPPLSPLNQSLLDAGFNYDHLNETFLLNCTVNAGMLQTTGGARYRAIVLPHVTAISPAFADKLRSFAAAGIPVLCLAALPQQASSFAGGNTANDRVQHAMTALARDPRFVLAAVPAQLVAQLQAKIQPNLRFLGDHFPFFERRLGDIPLYLIVNDADTPRTLRAEFHAHGYPQQWNSWTGTSSPLPFTQSSSGNTRIEIPLEPFESLLIVFAPTPGEKKQTLHELTARSQAITGPWNLTAQGMGPTPAGITIHRTLPSLLDWSLDPELRNFSGRGTYRTRFSMTDTPAARIVLDLGDVREVADVTVNGTLAGSLLLRPYTLDITRLVRPGDNTLEIAVTNTLFNAMIARKPPVFAPGPVENASGLMSGGLLGPVTLHISA
jgi:hypothetical protein